MRALVMANFPEFNELYGESSNDELIKEALIDLQHGDSTLVDTLVDIHRGVDRIYGGFRLANSIIYRLPSLITRHHTPAAVEWMLKQPSRPYDYRFDGPHPVPTVPPVEVLNQLMSVGNAHAILWLLQADEKSKLIDRFIPTQYDPEQWDSWAQLAYLFPERWSKDQRTQALQASKSVRDAIEAFVGGHDVSGLIAEYVLGFDPKYVQ
jgi:hypothetical protein